MSNIFIGCCCCVSQSNIRWVLPDRHAWRHAQCHMCHCHPARQQISVTRLSSTVHIRTQTHWIWFYLCFTDNVAWICCLWSCSRRIKHFAVCTIQETDAIRYWGSLCSTACVLQPSCTTTANPPTVPTRWAFMYTVSFCQVHSPAAYLAFPVWEPCEFTAVGCVCPSVPRAQEWWSMEPEERNRHWNLPLQI